MRMYQSCLEMLSETERELWEMGVRYQSYSVQDQVVKDDKGFMTMELPMYAYQLTKYPDAIEMLKKMNIDAAWARAEMHDRLNLALIKKNPGSAYVLRNALWDAFLHDGKFAYTYAERWHEQIPYVINELKLRPNSRQVMLTMYDRHQDMMNWGGRSRVPCSVSYQFMLRDGQLHMMYNQRSCDFIKFFAADVFFCIGLLKSIAAEVDVKPGIFTHILGSLHAFRKDLPEAIF